MICVHCGKSIPFGEGVCKYCGKETEYETRFHYQPQGEPFWGEEEDRMMREVLEELRRIDRKAEATAKEADAKRKKNQVLSIIIGAVFLASLILIGLMSGSSIRKLRDEAGAWRKQVESISIRQENETEMLDALLNMEEKRAERENTLERYLIMFDINLPEGDFGIRVQTPHALIWYPDYETPLYLPGLKDTDEFSFRGWREEDDDDLIFVPGEEYVCSQKSDITLHAVWVPKESEVSGTSENEGSDDNKGLFSQNSGGQSVSDNEETDGIPEPTDPGRGRDSAEENETQPEDNLYKNNLPGAEEHA